MCRDSLKAKSFKNRIVIVIYGFFGVNGGHREVPEECPEERVRAYFQPQYSVEKDTFPGFEALIRWRNDEMGFVTQQVPESG